MKNFNASFNVIEEKDGLVLSTKLPSGIELSLIFSDDGPKDEKKVNMKVESHENGQLMQYEGCNTTVPSSLYEDLRNSLGV